MNPGEGRLVAAAAVLVLAFSLAVCLESIPTGVEILPVHTVPDAVYLAEMLDINHASADEFAQLPGIGLELGGRIADYRAANGAFSSVEELKNVPGIGEGKLEALRNLIFIG